MLEQILKVALILYWTENFLECVQYQVHVVTAVTSEKKLGICR